MIDILLFKITVVLAGGIFIVSKDWKVRYSFLLHLAMAVITGSWALAAWQSNGPILIDLGIPLWGGTPSFIIDKLSAFFLLLINLTSLTGILYGSGYLKPYLETKSDIAISLHVWSFFVLHFAMLNVVMMREGFAFLIAWELMSMSSFLLVIFEGEQEKNLKTGIKYLVQMHAGFTFLLLGFLWVSQATGFFGFDGLAPYFASHRNWGIFLLLFAGFGVKAGFVPLHTWLPHAHPAAPSHVSGVMSGIMIKMGIYGILRLILDLHNDFLIIGLILTCVGIATGVVGILYATLQKDLKKILAYSSIENIGIIGLAMGVSVLGRYLQNDVLTTLGLTGALLHILNHSLYKSMLFYTAGNVYYAVHTRDLDRLGGLIRHLPMSGVFFLVGSLAICAIPPFNGFISEFLIYKSIFQTIGTADFSTSLMILVVMLSLVVIGGLSVYAFTKAFGIAFLGSRRSHHPHAVRDVPWSMRLSGVIITTLMVGIALASPWIITRVAEVGSLFSNLQFNNVVIEGNLPVLQKISLVNLLILGVAAALYLIRRVFQRKEIAHGPTWGCGYSAGDFRHQYTSTSFANYIREMAGPSVDVKDGYHAFQETEIFPQARKFETRTHDLVEEKLIIEPVESGIQRMMKIGWAQTGKINHYLVYPLAFLLIIMLLTASGAI